MSIFQIISIAIVGAIISMVLKQYNSDLSLMVGIATAVLIFMESMDLLFEVVNSLLALSDTYGVNTDFITLIIKILGISYLAQFAIDILKDGGENSIATKVEIFSKVTIIGFSLPILATLLSTVTGILNM